ncbi:hypothetical protein BDN72DRAFT_57216 [Pluteus cervinus]|uniref:Uncharacterized protein n=1 Tax=Pluteus cervinus TaxID=181527 RepID=A0ACD3BA15_9AGAR|nr:hypothetical protein BDN72DRAFT_57216 [Pluteus cervinus]
MKSQYLNVYSVGFRSGSGAGLLGYATLPSDYARYPSDDILFSSVPGGTTANNFMNYSYDSCMTELRVRNKVEDEVFSRRPQPNLISNRAANATILLPALVKSVTREHSPPNSELSASPCIAMCMLTWRGNTATRGL